MGSKRTLIPLSLTRNYAPNWDVWEGLREMVQNWHDGILQVYDQDLITFDRENLKYTLMKDDSAVVEYQVTAKDWDNKTSTLGWLHYSKVDNRLTLINRNIGLHKKCLLLGYSKKPRCRDVIGQFGEGMKIGALALLRRGRLVTMETSEDRWRFELQEDENFGEEVLTVVVSERSSDSASDINFPKCPVKLERADTCTTLSIQQGEWQEHAKRFLFLVPPENSVKTELGTLLLDKELQGQLYVKSVWVQDLRKDDLKTGVDFCQLEVDRDRHAVPHPSEIDHHVSSMWVRALERRPDLAGHYYMLVEDDKCRDVKYANLYNTQSTAMLMADQFAQRHGDSSFPVVNTMALGELQKVKDELNRNIVSCNKTLYEILQKSGRHVSVEEALADSRATKKKKVAINSPRLSDEQRDSLEHAVRLVQTADPDFRSSWVDIIQTQQLEGPGWHGSRIDVPYWMLDLETVHNYGRLCPQGTTKCMCREVRLCHALLELRRPHIKRSGGRSNDPMLLFVLNRLALQECHRAPPFCTASHQQGRPVNTVATHQDCVDREEQLQARVIELEKQVKQVAERNKTELNKLTTKLSLAEKEVMNKEISYHDAYRMFEEKFRSEVKKLKAQFETEFGKKDLHVRKLEEEAVLYRQTLDHRNARLDILEKEHASFPHALVSQHQVLVEEVQHYRGELQKRCALITQYVERQQTDLRDKSVKQKCQTITKMCSDMMEELHNQRYVCSVCHTKRRSHLIQPCGHYNSCETCLLKLTGCPLCKEPIESKIKVFE
ncbi:uncharacterized protein LOC144927711 [Branchiostoma floridae x Branchiostoma belcheri]